MSPSTISPSKTSKRKNSRPKSGNLQLLSTSSLLIAAITLSVIDLFIKIPGIFGILILIAATALSWMGYQTLRRRRWRRGARLLLVSTVSCLSSIWWITSIKPSYAQFFGDAEDFFENTFTSSADGVAIVFGALRALYILYIAVSFVGVINAVRQDEDWQTVARTPVLVVVVVTLADILTGMIIGGAA